MNLTQNLSRVYQTRIKLSDLLTQIKQAIDNSNLELQLDRELKDIQYTSKSLQGGVFRLLVL